jgi:hypothetical protein
MCTHQRRRNDIRENFDELWPHYQDLLGKDGLGRPAQVVAWRQETVSIRLVMVDASVS